MPTCARWIHSSLLTAKPYSERLVHEQKRTGMTEACTVGRGYMRGRPLVFGMTDSSFIMGSMGSVVGEKLCRAVEQATEKSLPLIIVSGSGGGARMHEGIVSLMQMGKVSAALARFRRAGGLFISVLTNPTMGGSCSQLCLAGRRCRGRTKRSRRIRGAPSRQGDMQDRSAGWISDQ